MRGRIVIFRGKAWSCAENAERFKVCDRVKGVILKAFAPAELQEKLDELILTVEK
jgi:hypothetical protein